MPTGIFVILAFLLSISFSGLVAFALITYIRRTWQVIRSEEVGSIQYRIVDELEQIRTQNYLLAERLERMEGALGDLSKADLSDAKSPDLLTSPETEDG
jgi:hypothetical protein